MTQLIWKDYRLHRSLFLLGAVVLVLLYAIGAGMEIHAAWPSRPTKEDWAALLVSYGTISMYLSIGVTAVLGGYAISCERADRTAHFLAYLPPNRGQILTSKFIVAGGASAMWWMWVIVTVFFVAPRLSARAEDVTGMVAARGVAAVCVLTFGVGWLGSACLENTIVPIIMAGASPVVVGFVMFGFSDALGIPRMEMAKWTIPTSLAAGGISFVAGTWAYLRRVEP
jgi:ABC-type transport system involved in multi-copper enzyme maturation permease subunit